MENSGLLCIVSGPSGAGKTSLCKELVHRVPGLNFSVSYTTRPAREGEREGVDYFFVTRETFAEMIKQGAFAEWAEIYGNLYGTTKLCIDRSLRDGVDLLFDIDPQGAEQVKQQYPQAVTVFLLPPSVAELESRLYSRSTDAPQAIDRRLQKARQEINRATEYEYLIMNEDLEQALMTLQSIIVAEKHRRHRMVQRVAWLKNL